MEALKENKAVLVIGVLIVAVLGWYLLSQSSSGNNSGSLLSSESVAGVTAAGDREMLQMLIDMRSIRLEGHLFEGQTFTSLRDFSKNIVPEPVGKRDPFAPAESQIGITAFDQEAPGLFE